MCIFLNRGILMEDWLKEHIKEYIKDIDIKLILLILCDRIEALKTELQS